ncbi:hypothetical protein MBLNU457_g0916t1 [Dothideomycetes sp. NU457]
MDSEQKVSRYRSQRQNRSPRVADASPSSSSPPIPSTVDNTTNVTRQPSRYHRPSKPAQSPSPPLAQSAQEFTSASNPQRNGSQTSDPEAPRNNTSQSTRENDATTAGAERKLSPKADYERKRRLEDNSISRRNVNDSQDRSQHSNPAHENPKISDRLQRRDSPASSEGQELPVSTAELYAPREIKAHRVDEKRPQEQEESAGCFGLFRKRRSEDSSEAEKTRQRNLHDAKKDGPAYIKQGGGGIVPGTDAPKSAVNAGDRRVAIESNKTYIEFPVDTTTTTHDLLISASNCFSERIDPKTFILMESYVKVGVQRPLRRYEHIRDVMNSWDDDLQNSLIAVPAAALGTNSALLHASNVPPSKPYESSFLLYYSQKVGKWDKRYITIRGDGQVVVSKNKTDKDATNVCHLSDFDIYTPTAKQASKKIKPPKKICYAIKSQQKTSMFETTTNFVHFFCTSDSNTAAAFYQAVQTWRSWYLVNVMGEGQKKQKTQEATAVVPNRSNSTTHGHAHQQSNGSMESHYMLGSFKPLVEVDQFNRPISSHGAQGSLPTRSRSTRDKAHPPVSLPKHMQLKEDEPLGNLVGQRSSVDGGERGSGTFDSSGLLGRSYSSRRREAAQRQEDELGAFTQGPSLLNSEYRPSTSDGTGVKRSPSTRQGQFPLDTSSGGDLRRKASTRANGELGRSGSRRIPKQPLVDLTPTYRDPPQHRKGKGFKPDDVTGVLIDNATSPEEAIQVPPAADWRVGRSGTRDAPSSSGSGDGVNRTKSQLQGRGRAPSASRTQAPAARFQNSDAFAALNGSRAPAPEQRRRLSGDGDDGFIQGGLLEHAGGGWGGLNKGRGVMQGSNAKGPMIDLNDGNQFAPGSLLAKQEMIDGPRAPLISR